MDGDGNPIGRWFVLEVPAVSERTASVYRARDLRTGARVALKVLRGASERSAARFAREIRALATLDHPHVVRYVDHGFDPAAGPFVALEWLEGQDLSNRMAAGALPRGDAVAIAHQAAQGLEAIHAAGVVHRDVKPSNIFLARQADGSIEAKVIDLGLSRVENDLSVTASTERVGTPAYMSPEQCLGDRAVTPASDVFSLGAVIYQMLSGRRPFDGTNPFTILAKILLTEPTPLREILPDLPAELDAIVSRALAKSPAHRFRSARSLADALAAFSGRSVGSGAVSPASGVPATRRGGAGVAGETARTLPDEAGAERPAFGASEQRVVTVVFAQFGRRREPGFAAFARTVTEHAGVSYRSVGRRAIAVFGSIKSCGEDPDRAGHAALTLRERIPDVALALATGRASARAGDVVGEVLERGAAELVRAGPGIVLDASTARLLAPRFVIESSLGGAALRAVRHGAPPVHTLLGQPTMFRGRRRELADLESLFDACLEGDRPRAAVLTAPAGIGKSRLAWEFTSRVGARAEVLYGCGDPLGASSFGLLAAVVRGASGVRDGDDVRVKRTKLRERVARCVPRGSRQRITEFLGEMARVTSSTARSARLSASRADSSVMAESLRFAWREWIRAECEARPVVLVLEDFHWADEASARLVAATVASLIDTRLFVLALARPEARERFPGLWSGCGAVETHLGPLDAGDCADLARDALGPNAPEGTVERWVARCEGNPFYLEEMVLVGPSCVEAPDTVLGLVQARIDELDPEARWVLRAGAVFGDTFWSGGVAAMSGTGGRRAEIDEALGVLVSRDFLSRRSHSAFPGEAEYRFRHGLVRDAARAMSPDEDRAPAHRLAAAWLESVGEPDPAVLAEHYRRGCASARAVYWYVTAAERALDANDFAGVLAHVEAALPLVGDDRASRGALRTLESHARRWRGETSRAIEAGADALAHLTAGSARWFDAAGALLVVYGRSRASHETEKLAAKLLERPEAEGTGALAMLAWSSAAAQLLAAGVEGPAEALYARIERFAVRAPRQTPLVSARIDEARALRALLGGDTGTAVERFESTAAALDAAGNVRGACTARINAAHAYVELGAYGRAKRVLERVIPRADAAGLAFVAGRARGMLGEVLGRQGRFADARAAFALGLEAVAAQGDRHAEAEFRWAFAGVLFDAGDLDGADREAAVTKTRSTEVPAGRMYAAVVHVQVALARAQTARALAEAREALAVLEALPREDAGEARVRLAFAEALRAAGQHDEALGVILAARERLITRAARIARVSWRESFLKRVPEHARTLRLAKKWADVSSTRA